MGTLAKCGSVDQAGMGSPRAMLGERLFADAAYIIISIYWREQETRDFLLEVYRGIWRRCVWRWRGMEIGAVVVGKCAAENQPWLFSLSNPKTRFHGAYMKSCTFLAKFVPSTADYGPAQAQAAETQLTAPIPYFFNYLFHFQLPVKPIYHLITSHVSNTLCCQFYLVDTPPI